MKIVNYDLAKDLQNLHYNGEYLHNYEDYDRIITDSVGRKYPALVPAPRYDDVAYWLDKEFGIGIYPYDSNSRNISRNSEIESSYELIHSSWIIWEATELTRIKFSSYEEALVTAVERAIDIIKNKEKGEEL